ncbi:MAG TPA: class I SAM-dependent methyltransferase [Candidatus Acidoferrales bacterium]|nr:class I SAM-dependent methyltransferase [Candidatus Acidoferrales bacterium]
MKLQQRAELAGAKGFLGVPVEGFAKGGREQLIYLLTAGLEPCSKVVDVGCGLLRGGYWLIHFLDPDCYCGIEPHEGRLRIGMQTILEPEILEAKRPRFDVNPRFDTSVFGEKFDYFLAYSVWTHASKPHIRAMLDSFLRDSKEDGVFLASYLPADWRHPDYQGESWFGNSHESDAPGCIYHSFRWIETECRHRGLAAQKLERDKTHGQSWLAIARWR